MELRDIVAMVRSSAVAIVILAALGVILGAVSTLTTVPTYRAHSTVMVSVVTGESVNDLSMGATFVSRQVATYAELAQAPKVLQPVITTLGLQTTPAALAANVTASAQTNTALIDIYVTDTDAGRAAAIANAIDTELSSVVKQTSPVQANGGSAISVVAIAPAIAPATPFAPSLTTNVGMGLLVGLLLGLGWAVLRRSLDTKVRTEQDARALTDAPILGAIADDARGRRARAQRPVVAAPLSARAETFRQLRTNLQFINAANRPRSFVVTSTRSGEGKSSTAIDLAFALSESGSSVCLVDADLRRPTIAAALGIEGGAGLTNVLIGQADTDHVLQTVNSDGLQVIASGPTPPNPSELLSSSAMARVIAELESRFDTVIFDGAPLLPVTDSAVLAKLTGGALVVVASAQVTRDQLTEALAKLTTIDGRTLGIVLNRVRNRQSSSSAYRYRNESPSLGEGPTFPVPAHSSGLERPVWDPQPTPIVETVPRATGNRRRRS